MKPLVLGPMEIWPPVVLAPMAGVTDAPFRDLCRSHGAGLYVSEMITARPLVEGNRKTLRLAAFGPRESPRSIQLYGTDPHYLGEAVRILVSEDRVDHIDLNFGCPVPKVTRRGGGAALPFRRPLLRRLLRAAVAAAGDVPVTAKFRIGIDDTHQTHLDTGRIAEDEGCAGVALHARTAAQLYSGHARWEAIAALKDAVQTIPVLGNGDIWEWMDALAMMRQTGCDGVVVGRGCLGRPWLFRELALAFDGQEPGVPPGLRDVGQIMSHHARALVSHAGPHGIRMFRKHATWYIKGFAHAARLREQLMQIRSLADLDAIVQSLPEEPFPVAALRAPRGKAGGTQRVVLPQGYLDDPHVDHALPGADQLASGG